MEASSRSTPPSLACRSERLRFWASSASSRPKEAVAQMTVVSKSRASSNCMSTLPGPVGTVMAPSRSAPSWKPMPAVQSP